MHATTRQHIHYILCIITLTLGEHFILVKAIIQLTKRNTLNGITTQNYIELLELFFPSSSSSSLFFLPFVFAFKPVGIYVRAKSVNVYVWVCHIGNLFTARKCCWNTSRHQTKWMGSKRSEGNADKMHAFKALVTFWCVYVRCTCAPSTIINDYLYVPVTSESTIYCQKYRVCVCVLPAAVDDSLLCKCTARLWSWYNLIKWSSYIDNVVRFVGTTVCM